MRSRRQFLGAGTQLAAAASLGALSSAAFAAEEASGAARNGPVVATVLSPGITLLTGAGCSVVAMQGPEGSLLIDGGLAKHSKALLKAAVRVTGNHHVATLINTHWHPAQTGSNETIGNAGGEIIAHEVTKLYLARAVASIDYAGLYGPLAPSGLPTKTTRIGGALAFAGQSVNYGYLPAAHTNGDLYVHFPALNLLVAGGPVSAEAWPLLDYRNGAWLGGLVRAHEKLATLVQPDTRIVPAQGRLLTGAELLKNRDMFRAFHEKMVVFQNRGMDSGDCIAAQPLKDHEAQFGDAAPFIHGAFSSLNLAYSPD